MLFDKLSPSADFISKIQSDLLILMKNVLYTTHECNKILKLLKKIDNNTSLQKQVDEYFDETSHQTDSEEHGSNNRNNPDN